MSEQEFQGAPDRLPPGAITGQPGQFERRGTSARRDASMGIGRLQLPPNFLNTIGSVNVPVTAITPTGGRRRPQDVLRPQFAEQEFRLGPAERGKGVVPGSGRPTFSKITQGSVPPGHRVGRKGRNPFGLPALNTAAFFPQAQGESLAVQQARNERLRTGSPFKTPAEQGRPNVGAGGSVVGGARELSPEEDRAVRLTRIPGLIHRRRRIAMAEQPFAEQEFARKSPIRKTFEPVPSGATGLGGQRDPGTQEPTLTRTTSPPGAPGTPPGTFKIGRRSSGGAPNPPRGKGSFGRTATDPTRREAGPRAGRLDFPSPGLSGREQKELRKLRKRGARQSRGPSASQQQDIREGRVTNAGVSDSFLGQIGGNVSLEDVIRKVDAEDAGRTRRGRTSRPGATQPIPTPPGGVRPPLSPGGFRVDAPPRHRPRQVAAPPRFTPPQIPRAGSAAGGRRGVLNLGGRQRRLALRRPGIKRLTGTRGLSGGRSQRARGAIGGIRGRARQPFGRPPIARGSSCRSRRF